MNAPTRKATEGVLEYYQRLKEGVAEGTLDFEKSEIYALLFGENVSADHARKAMRTLDMTLDVGGVTMTGAGIEEELPNKTTLEINKDGWHTSSKLLRMKDEDTKNATFLLKAHGYDVNFWELISARSNIWNAYSKQDGIMELYSSKITTKPKVNGLDYEDVARHFEVFSKSYVHKEVIPRQYAYGAECLVPCLFDVHFSKLAEDDETGNKYDWRIAHERVIASIDSYINRLEGRRFEKIIFVVGNDYFNCEPPGNTVNNTPQDNDTRYSKCLKRCGNLD